MKIPSVNLEELCTVTEKGFSVVQPRFKTMYKDFNVEITANDYHVSKSVTFNQKPHTKSFIVPQSTYGSK